MNKRGEESHWGTIGGAVLIILALVVVLFVFSDSFAEIKKGFEKIADKEAIEKAREKTIGKEDALTEEEKKVIDQFNLFFRNLIGDSDDCIKRINFDDIKGKGFGIRVSGGNVFAEKEERARVHQLTAVPSMFVLQSDSTIDRFSIDENFENIDDELEIEDFVYIKDSKIYFLDYFGDAILRGFFSDVPRKPYCGNAAGEKVPVKNVEIKDVGGEILEEPYLVDYFNEEIEYLGSNYKIYDLLKYLFDLHVQRNRGDFPIEEEMNSLLDKLGEHIENYFGEGYRRLPDPSENVCWIGAANFGYPEDTLSYGKSRGSNLVYRKIMLELSDGSRIDFTMSVSRDGCLPAREIDKLLEIYRNVGAPESE